MGRNIPVLQFLDEYDSTVVDHVMLLRQLVTSVLPGVTEQLDIPARMIAYCYGQKYTELVCTIIPSKKGLKLGFNRGRDLPDPAGLLEGTGKISRFVVVENEEIINSPGLKELLRAAYHAYLARVS